MRFVGRYKSHHHMQTHEKQMPNVLEVITSPSYHNKYFHFLMILEDLVIRSYENDQKGIKD